MTPAPPKDEFVTVSLRGIEVSLGYVTVAGLWQDQALPVPHWQNVAAPRPVIWMTQAPPTRWESD